MEEVRLSRVTAGQGKIGLSNSDINGGTVESRQP